MKDIFTPCAICFLTSVTISNPFQSHEDVNEIHSQTETILQTPAPPPIITTHMNYPASQDLYKSPHYQVRIN